MTDGFRQVLRALGEGTLPTREETREAMHVIMQGEATPAQIGAFLMGLRVLGETAEQIAGAAESMRDHARRLHTAARPLVDTCGTGGDGAGTFNISTAAAFVVAGGGIAVAKHGNRSISSRCGSADVLEALGARIDLEPETTARCIETTGFGFLFAPHYHQATRHAAGPRRELGMRTLFNLLGPLSNPAPVTHQVMGVYDAALLPLAARVLGLLGLERALVVHGEGGLDEIAIRGRTRTAEWRDGAVREGSVTPAELGVEEADPAALRGGDAAENAGIIRSVLSGETGPRRDVVCANAGAMFYVTGKASTPAEGVRLASETLASGRALKALEAYCAFTRDARSDG